eukprot:366229-Chlamydomonas_euryale.AAC.37
MEPLPCIARLPLPCSHAAAGTGNRNRPNNSAPSTRRGPARVSRPHPINMTSPAITQRSLHQPRSLQSRGSAASALSASSLTKTSTSGSVSTTSFHEIGASGSSPGCSPRAGDAPHSKSSSGTQRPGDVSCPLCETLNTSVRRLSALLPIFG